MAVTVLLEFSRQYKGSSLYEILSGSTTSRNLESVTNESTYDETCVSESILVLDLQLHTLEHKNFGYFGICLDLHYSLSLHLFFFANCMYC